MEKISFFIFFYERSGSTLLTKLLNQHPEISCFPEVFHLNWNSEIKGERGKPFYKTEEEINQQLYRIFEKPTKKACGFKYKYPGQFGKYPSVYNYIKKQSETIRLIFLYRKNRLKGAISKQNQLKLKSLNGESNVSIRSTVTLPPLKLNINNALKYATHREKADLNFYKKTKIFNHRYVISYEEILEDTIGETQKIFDFLNVQTDFVPQIETKKLTSNSIKEAIINYDFLKKRLKCHPMEKYLD